jgi:excisionase family DNA binding protein
VDLGNRLALTVGEAAQAIGVSERHLRNTLSEIPHVRIGGRVLVPVAPFQEWLRDQAKAGKGQVDEAVDEILQSLDENK